MSTNNSISTPLPEEAACGQFSPSGVVVVKRWKKGERHPETGLKFWQYVRGYQRWCSDVVYEERMERSRQWRRQWYPHNKERTRAHLIKHKNKNPSLFNKKSRARTAKWKAENKEKSIQLRRENRAMRYATDPVFRLKTNMRNRLGEVLRANGYMKKGRTFSVIGCTPPELRLHLENLFSLGMTWENHGSVWEIDHEKPLASGITEKEILRLCHFTNLRPIYKEENRSKGSRII
jgi:hypothetical protein